jgi:hypothetical protein
MRFSRNPFSTAAGGVMAGSVSFFARSVVDLDPGVQ